MKNLLGSSRFWGTQLLIAASIASCSCAELVPAIGLHRTFERVLQNDKPYRNKFNDVELRCKYTSPSKRDVSFIGFFDGDGKGGGNATTGNVWKLRFLPDEVGTWTYTWSWSDGTPGGSGQFECTQADAGKGVLHAFQDNPHWFAYNGTDPVWLKSYYETGHGSIAQDFDWISENVYQPLIDRGYNHLQVNWLLSLCCFKQYYLDGPKPTSFDLALYEEGKASSTMRLDVWHLMERRMSWLNDRNVGLHMFLGFEGRKNDGPAWEQLTAEEQDFYVRYVVARLAPYANLAGWNFVWEDPGHRETHELGLARLLEKYDIFNHLRTYQDENPRENEYRRPEYTFAAIENHMILAPTKDIDRNFHKSALSHHLACLVAYVPGKPVYMSEGNGLWRRYWAERSGATQDDLRQSAWACATAGASFCWNGHAKEYELIVRGPEGMPFHGDDNPYVLAAKYIDILTDVMNERVEFFKMAPSDYLLTGHDPTRVWCLAEQGRQYLVFAMHGEPFTLHLGEGAYDTVKWIDSKTGAEQPAETVAAAANELATDAADERRNGTKGVAFTPPNRESDWVLVVRK